MISTHTNRSQIHQKNTFKASTSANVAPKTLEDFLEKLYFTDSDGMLVIYPKLTDPDFCLEDLNLNVLYVSEYNDISSINDALCNPELDLIIFEDAKLLAVVVPVLKYKRGIATPKIIVFTSWGDSIDHLNIVLSLFKLSLVKYDMHKQSNVSWLLSTTQMSNHQLEHYDHVKSNEQHPLSKSKMVTLYRYPFEIQSLDICGTTPPIKNWINKNHLDTLDIDGPKLKQVLQNIVVNAKSGSFSRPKQIVFTRFNHYYGVDLIRDFLHLLDVEDVYTISCTDDDPFPNFKNFNDLSSGVLVTNIVPLTKLQNVKHLHIVDSYSFHSLKSVLSKCAESSSIQVHIYLATHPKEESADEILYNMLLKHVNDTDKLYFELIKNATPILERSNIGNNFAAL